MKARFGPIRGLSMRLKVNSPRLWLRLGPKDLNIGTRGYRYAKSWVIGVNGDVKLCLHMHLKLRFVQAPGRRSV